MNPAVPDIIFQHVVTSEKIRLAFELPANAPIPFFPISAPRPVKPPYAVFSFRENTQAGDPLDQGILRVEVWDKGQTDLRIRKICYRFQKCLHNLLHFCDGEGNPIILHVTYLGFVDMEPGSEELHHKSLSFGLMLGDDPSD